MAKTLTVPERLKWLLKDRGWSQNQLAKVAGVSPQTVANTVTNGRNPQTKTQGRFARALGVPKWVFDEKKSMDALALGKVAKAGTPKAMPASKTAKKKTTAKKTTTARKKTTAKKKTAAKKPATRKKTTAAKKKTTTARKPAARKTTARKKTTTRKPAARKKTTAARKRTATTRKPAARKTTAKKSTARKPVAKKKTAGTKSVAEQVYKEITALINKGVATKTAVNRVAKKRGITPGTAQNQYYRWKREAGTGARNIVRHVKPKAKTTTRKKAASRKRTTARTGTRRAATNGKVDIDLNAVVTRLEKLRKSKNESVAVEACKALLTLR